ncbi:unnamed protein product [Prunus armeniaca]|uniref:Oxidoreductase N-terminal domain-containing protein n=1 Tax=Prunus armeniaca TaxID=36596 RepID=A0A6J5UCL5_PRUAR|nr:unnamed protein product [Prunus armeniaca]
MVHRVLCTSRCPNSDHLKICTAKLSLALNSIPERHAVLLNLFLSVDPYLRSRMTGLEDGLYLPQFNLNEVHIFTVEH